MKNFKEYSGIFEEFLCKYLKSVGDLESLYGPIKYFMYGGGKRLRPSLLLMSCESFGGSLEDGKNAALGIELFHNFTLLHDDVMDRSDLRRGRETVHKRWDENSAILSGDAMLTLATEKIMDVEDDKLRSVLDVFNRMAMKVYEGQRLDMDFETREDVGLDEYLEMVYGKTAALLGASVEIGAIIGGGDLKDCVSMREFGENLGIAFQIADDYLDLYGDSEKFGKPIGGDILNDKKTFLMLTAFETGDEVEHKLKKCLSEMHGNEKIKAVREIFDSASIPNICREAILKYSALADEALKKANIAEGWKYNFRELTMSLVGRIK